MRLPVLPWPFTIDASDAVRNCRGRRRTMLIESLKKNRILSSEITPEAGYRSRRQFMMGADGLAAGALAAGTVLAQSSAQSLSRSAADLNLARQPGWLQAQVAAAHPVPESGPYTTDEALTPFDDVTPYNNFYEFGSGKSDPSSNARDFRVEPWTVEVVGAVAKPGTYDLEDLIKGIPLEERIYRLRCVEAWSMVIPWTGFPLSALINRLEPTSDAKFVEFRTLVDPKQMPAQSSRFASIDWPYQEGLRMDEAMHPLTLMAVGL